MPRLAACLLILTIVVCAHGLSAAPADKQQWGFVSSDDDVRLFYGVPESDVVTLSIICEPKRKRMDFVSFVLPPKARQGAGLKINLINGGARLAYDGKVGRDRTHEVSYVEVRLGFDRTLMDFLNTGSTLTVEVAGTRRNIPLARIAEPLGTMRRACLGPA